MTGIPGRIDHLTWQEQFDSWFPRGALMHVVLDVPEEEDGAAYIVPRIVVTEELEDHPRVMLASPGLKTIESQVMAIEAGKVPSELLVTLRNGAPLNHRYRLSDDLTPAAIEFAQMARESAPGYYRLDLS